jgi:hypothetical protein
MRSDNGKAIRRVMINQANKISEILKSKKEAKEKIDAEHIQQRDDAVKEEAVAKGAEMSVHDVSKQSTVQGSSQGEDEAHSERSSDSMAV